MLGAHNLLAKLLLVLVNQVTGAIQDAGNRDRRHVHAGEIFKDPGHKKQV